MMKLLELFTPNLSLSTLLEEKESWKLSDLKLRCLAESQSNLILPLQNSPKITSSVILSSRKKQQSFRLNFRHSSTKQDPLLERLSMVRVTTSMKLWSKSSRSPASTSHLLEDWETWKTPQLRKNSICKEPSAEPKTTSSPTALVLIVPTWLNLREERSTTIWPTRTPWNSSTKF